MITKKYKTLKGLFNANELKELRFSDFLSKRVYSKKAKQFISFKLSDEAKDEACRLFATGISSGSRVKKYVDLIRRYNAKNYGIFDGLIIEKGKTFRGVYFAGQDYIPETNIIRRCLREN